MTRMKNSPNAPIGLADYAHAVEVPIDDTRSTLYLCGMGPRDPIDNTMPSDVTAQSENVFKNIETVIVDAGGQGLVDVVDVQVFLTDIPRDFAAFNAVWKSHMVAEDGFMPTRTTVQVAALPLPAILVELKCIAVINKGEK